MSDRRLAAFLGIYDRPTNQPRPMDRLGHRKEKVRIIKYMLYSDMKTDAISFIGSDLCKLLCPLQKLAR